MCIRDRLWTVWNQEYETENPEAEGPVPYDAENPDHFLGLDSWMGRVDYVVDEPVPE